MQKFFYLEKVHPYLLAGNEWEFQIASHYTLSFRSG